MNVDELLRAADPAARHALPPTHVDDLLATTRVRRDTPSVSVVPERVRRRPVAVAVVAAVLVAGVVGAVVAVTGGRTGGGPAPAASSPSPAPSTLPLVVQAPGGLTVTLAMTTTPDGRTCIQASTPSTPSSPSTSSEDTEPFRDVRCWTAVELRPQNHGVEFRGAVGMWEFTAPDDGRAYRGAFGRALPGTVQVQLRVGATVVSSTDVVDGWFLTTGLPSDQTGCVNARGVDASGALTFGQGLDDCTPPA